MTTWPPSNVPAEHRSAFTREAPPCHLEFSQAFQCSADLRIGAVAMKDGRTFYQYRCATCKLTASEAVKKQCIPKDLLTNLVPAPSEKDAPHLPAAMAALRSAMGGPEQGFFFDRPEWQKTRRAVMRRDRTRCRLCRNEEAMSVHHKTYENCNDDFVAPLSDLVSLCLKCHGIIHEWNPYDQAARFFGLRHSRTDLESLYGEVAPALCDPQELVELRARNSGSGIWTAFRSYVMEISRGRCAVCDRPAEHLHHKVYRGLTKSRGLEPLSDVCALCEHCHTRIHQWNPIEAFIPKVGDNSPTISNCASRYKGFYMHLLNEPYWYFKP